MKIAIAGKGGSGKTTIAGTLARLVARRGRAVWAIDADTNPNLASTLGMTREQALAIAPIPRTLLEDRLDAEGRKTVVLSVSASEVVDRFGVDAPDGVRLLMMGRVDHAAAGCMCRAHATVRHLLGAVLENSGPFTIVDMEAGLEHLTRGTARHVSTLLVVLEPYYKALETARRGAELARELGIPVVGGVANKIRNDEDAAAVRAYAAAHDLTIIGEVPDDEAVRRADRQGKTALDAGESPAVTAIDRVAERLLTL